MYLRITKQLSQIDAEGIRGLKAKEQNLRNLKDFKFLADGVKLKNIFEEKRRWYEIPTSEKVFKCYGAFNLPKYRLLEGNKELVYCERNGRNRIWRRSFNLSLGDAPSFLGGISLHARIFQDDYDAEEYTLHLTEATKSNIFSIASYFYNKRAFYNKIYAFLEKNKNKFETLMGKEFIRQLTSLFSANKNAKEITAYNLTGAEKYEIFQQAPAFGPTAACLPLCFTKIFSLENKYGMRLRIDYSLGAANTLVIEVNAFPYQDTISFQDTLVYFLESASLRTEKKNKNFTVPVFEAFMKKYLSEQLNTCLTDMEKMINFGFDIYETVKTKLLINNL